MKRLFDLTVSSLALVVTSPVILAAAIAVKLDSPGPAFYSGPRVGRDGKEFRIHKLRTMTVGAESRGPAITAADDLRVTSVGRALRRLKIDELPQLLNVVKGEMSLVGPRPEHPRFVERYTPEQRTLLRVRPGITSPTSLAFMNEEEFLAGGDAEVRYVESVMPDKLAADLRYVKTASFAGDLRILGRTAQALLGRAFRRGASSRRP